MPERVMKQFIMEFADLISEELLFAISKIKKWSDQGRESLVVDINYLRSTIEG